MVFPGPLYMNDVTPPYLFLRLLFFSFFVFIGGCDPFTVGQYVWWYLRLPPFPYPLQDGKTAYAGWLLDYFGTAHVFDAAVLRSALAFSVWIKCAS